jgi:hypothetical protein
MMIKLKYNIKIMSSITQTIVHDCNVPGGLKIIPHTESADGWVICHRNRNNNYSHNYEITISFHRAIAAKFSIGSINGNNEAACEVTHFPLQQTGAVWWVVYALFDKLCIGTVQAKLYVPALITPHISCAIFQSDCRPAWCSISNLAR